MPALILICVPSIVSVVLSKRMRTGKTKPSFFVLCGVMGDADDFAGEVSVAGVGKLSNFDGDALFGT